MNNKTISKYEANYENKYKSYFMGRECLVPLKSKLADLINSDWIYSMHWSKDHNTWVEQAKRDATAELRHARDRVVELEDALALIDKVEVNYE